MADRRRKSGVVNLPVEAVSSSTDSTMGSGAMGKAPKERKQKKPKERWLLTRKTWRYMADAGRKLIPEGALNRPEDVPKIEAYFQEVCQKEPRFLLWRKGSYPGALTFRSNRRKKDRRKGGSCRTKSSSADEADDIKKSSRPSDLALISHSSGGRFDIQKLKYDFLNKPPPSTTSPTSSTFHRLGETLASMKEEESEETQLINMLEKYLTISEKGPAAIPAGAPPFDYQELIDKLQQHLSTVYKSVPKTPSPSTSKKMGTTDGVHFEGDHVQKSLSETLSRYYSRSSNREHVISDLLTNRKLLEGLYFDLRRTKNFTGSRTGGSRYNQNTGPWSSSNLRHTDVNAKYDADDDSDSLEISGWKRLGKSVPRFRRDGGPMSPPPLIEIRGESQEEQPTYVDWGIQTDPIPEAILLVCDEEYKKMVAEKEQDIKDQRSAGYRRRSSVDNDDVSPSVSDTIKRYLRMARKKSVDSDKAVDRFKRVNYDRNLRNIKAKGEITKPGDDDGLNKGCQTIDEWILTYRDLKFDEIVLSDPDTSALGSRVTSSRSSYDAAGDDPQVPNSKQSSCPSSPPSGFLSTSQSFLSNLWHGKNQQDAKTANSTSAAQAAAVMQKSKSSSSVMHHGSRLVAKKIFRSRSKSQTRIQTTPSSWTPQGSCSWSNVTGRQITLAENNLTHLSDIERRVLQKVALAKLQALNLGVAIRVPCETAGQTVQKSKRRAYLLKRKAKTTSFFDTGRKDDKEKDGSTTGLVFGIPLSQCLENDRVSRVARGGSPFRSRCELSGSGDDAATLRRQSHHGSRASFSSLIDSPQTEESGSCESLMSRERILGSVPGLLDSLSCGSTADLASATATEEEPGVPNMVTACLRYLESYGLHTTGIFRVSSSKKRVRQLREDFDSGKETVLDEEQCPHDVATLLKEYLRDLPDPLLCRDLYHAFVLTQRIRNRRLQLEAIQHLIQLLPVPNRDTLSVLLMFLASVARNSSDTKDATGECIPGNKMDSNNLATVFAPNILHCVKQSSSSKDVSIDRPEDRIDVINVIRTMIDHHKQLFTIPAELLDEVYVHMMDSHPEALDTLLNKRDAATISDADLADDCESESNSAPWTPTTHQEMTLDPALIALQQHQSSNDYDGRHTPPEPRKTYSREEFLHENAGTGGPNVAMRLRYRDRDRVEEREDYRGRKRMMPKKRRDDSATRRRGEDSSALSSAMTIITRFRSGSQKDEDPVSVQTRSSSMDSTNSVPTDANEVQSRLMRFSSEDRRQSSPLLLDNSGVITASLKIPVQGNNTNNQIMPLSLDDADIPYVDDGTNNSYGYCGEQNGKQQMTIGVFKSAPSAPPRRRQRSVSGSDSSQASNIQPITGSISVIQQGYDSAMGSSTTFSSPPLYTGNSSVSSSITGDAGVYSSPASWASSPPTSPDSVHTSVNYIPDDLTQTGSSKYASKHVPVTTQKLQIEPATTAKDSSSPILQKVSFTSTSELQQIKQAKQIDMQKYQKGKKEIPKSASTTAVISHKADVESIGVGACSTVSAPPVKKEQRASASISSIGGAVLRSKTADFERMLRLGKPETKTVTKQVVSTTTSTSTTTSEKKKYAKRRYTDSRHDTRHIPDSDTLDKTNNSSEPSKTKEKTSTSSGPTQSSQVYKRRELIASVPKDKHSIL